MAFTSPLKSPLFQEFSRKLVHLSSLWMAVFIYAFPPIVSQWFFGGLLATVILIELLRMQGGWFTHFVNSHFKFIMRDHEKVASFDIRALTGSFYFVLSVFLAVILFDKYVAIAGLVVMIFSDTMAALIGKAFGRHRIKGTQKTIEGGLAFFATTLVILLWLTPLSLAAVALASLVLAIVEIYSHRLYIDDNLSITLGTCVMIVFLGGF